MSCSTQVVELMPNSRTQTGPLIGRRLRWVVIPGLTARLKKFADLDTGKGKVYYTRIPDLARDNLEFKLTSKLFVLDNPEREVFFRRAKASKP